MKPPRLLCLDALRFLAAFAVLVYHLGFRGYAADGLTQMPPPAIFSGWAKYGYLGVELFFLISGFVILMSANGARLTEFVIARLTRLYPAFWICCLITAGVSLMVSSALFSVSLLDLAKNLTMLNALWGGAYVDGVYWTLFVEIKFYLLVVAVIALGWLPRAELLLASWWILAMLAQASIRPFRWAWPFLMPDYAPYFISGAVCFLIYRSGFSAFRLIILLAAYSSGLQNALDGAAKNAAHYGTQFSPEVVALVLLLFHVLMASVSKLELVFPRWKFWSVLGGLSYPVYLLHQNIGYMFFDFFYPQYHRSVIFSAAIVLITGLAAAVHFGIEKRYSLTLKSLLLDLSSVIPRKWREL